MLSSPSPFVCARAHTCEKETAHIHTHMERERGVHAYIHWRGRVEHAHFFDFTHMHIRRFVGTSQPVLCAKWVGIELTTKEILAVQVLVPGSRGVR